MAVIVIVAILEMFATRKYPLRGYFLGVLTHTTAWDRLGEVSKLSSLGLK